MVILHEVKQKDRHWSLWWQITGSKEMSHGWRGIRKRLVTQRMSHIQWLGIGTGSSGKWLWHLAWQSSGSAWKMPSGTWCDFWGYPIHGQDPMIQWSLWVSSTSGFSMIFHSMITEKYNHRHLSLCTFQNKFKYIHLCSQGFRKVFWNRI